jgi:hypothetical protein
VEAWVVFDLVGVGVDREDLVFLLAQTLINGVASVNAKNSRDSRYGDTLLGQELGCGFANVHHIALLSGTTTSNPRTRFCDAAQHFMVGAIGYEPWAHVHALLSALLLRNSFAVQ